jgi:hypothetical protein
MKRYIKPWGLVLWWCVLRCYLLLRCTVIRTSNLKGNMLYKMFIFIHNCTDSLCHLLANSLHPAMYDSEFILCSQRLYPYFSVTVVQRLMPLIEAKSSSSCNMTWSQEGRVVVQYSSTVYSKLEGGCWSALRPDRFTPGKGTRYPFCKRLADPFGRNRMCSVGTNTEYKS